MWPFLVQELLSTPAFQDISTIDGIRSHPAHIGGIWPSLYPRPLASLSFQIPSLNYAMPFLSFIVRPDMHPSLPLESFNSLPSDNNLFSLISARRLCASDCDNVARCPYFCLSCVLPYVAKSYHMQSILYKSPRAQYSALNFPICYSLHCLTGWAWGSVVVKALRY
jgi:hypothetical protein